MVDAAVFEPVPVKAALRDGCTHVLVLCSRPPDVRSAWSNYLQRSLAVAIKRALLSPVRGFAARCPHRMHVSVCVGGGGADGTQARAASAAPGDHGGAACNRHHVRIVRPVNVGWPALRMCLLWLADLAPSSLFPPAAGALLRLRSPTCGRRGPRSRTSVYIWAARWMRCWSAWHKCRQPQGMPSPEAGGRHSPRRCRGWRPQRSRLRDLKRSRQGPTTQRTRLRQQPPPRRCWAWMAAAARVPGAAAPAAASTWRPRRRRPPRPLAGCWTRTSCRFTQASRPASRPSARM